ncbi:hypothetical protein GEMRC1_000484 [Eukaryota sp. GEM-RC1]
MESTSIVFLLDRSGSMHDIVDDVIGGFNSTLEEQKKVPFGSCFLTTVLFDNMYEVLHDQVDIHAVPPLSRSEFVPRGSTALLDAIGRAISAVESQVSNTPSNVVFVIFTDGKENASREFTAEQIRKLVRQKEDECQWKFLFLGANIDSFSEASKIGFSANRVANFSKRDQGSLHAQSAVSQYVTQTRTPKYSSVSEEEPVLSALVDEQSSRSVAQPMPSKVSTSRRNNPYARTFQQPTGDDVDYPFKNLSVKPK